MNKVYKRIQYKIPKLNQVEKNVLDYCLCTSENIFSMTAAELASKTFTSQPTITRMAKKLGFQGYQEFKFAIKNNLHFEQEDVHENEQTSLSPLINELFQQMLTTFEELDLVQIDCAVEMLKEANRIEIFALGQSIPVAVSVNRKLHFLGKNVGHSTDWDELTAISKQLTEQDLAIFISHSGETMGMLNYAELLNKRNVPILSFLGQRRSTLEAASTAAFIAEMMTIYHHDIDLSSRASLDILLDIVMIQYAKQMKTE